MYKELFIYIHSQNHKYIKTKWLDFRFDLKSIETNCSELNVYINSLSHFHFYYPFGQPLAFILYILLHGHDCGHDCVFFYYIK